MALPHDRNSAADVLMIRPASFGSNPETRESNAFQSQDPAEIQADSGSVLQEFERVVQAMSSAGVRVHVFDDLPVPPRPDAVFPNNWVSFHRDGTIVVYPMMSRLRRRERRLDVLAELVVAHGFRTNRLVDLTHHELEGRYLEGTGSLVLDRIHRVAYACRSPRTSVAAVEDFARLLDYEVMLIDAADGNGRPIYHTNVMMTLGTNFAAVCLPAIAPDQRRRVTQRLEDSGREIIELSVDQMQAFAGNMIELGTQDGTTILALSESARASLAKAQRESLARSAGPLVAVAVPTIERFGGGSVRCMIAEIHLPLQAG